MIACRSTQCIVAICSFDSPDVYILLQEDVHLTWHMMQCICDMPSESSSFRQNVAFSSCMTHLIKSVTMSVQSPNMFSSLCLRFPSVSFPPALQYLQSVMPHATVSATTSCIGITESSVSMLSIRNVLKQSWAR